MLSLDDRTGNVLTTIGLFAAIAGVAFAARATLVVVALALLLAYLLEPVVAGVQGVLPWRSGSRPAAITVVYVIGIVLLIGVGYTLTPSITAQLDRLHAALPDMIARVADSRFLSQHSSQIGAAAERTARAMAAAVQDTGWFLMVPIVAVFLLNSREALLDGAVTLFTQRGDRARVAQTIEQIDTTLGQFTRAQLVLAGLSAAFYSGLMAPLGFPFPLALGLLGGALEFLPVVGWILSAGIILTSGWIVHAHWIWMAGLIVLWRIVQNFVISPRVMGDRLEMEPITVVVALMAGGQIGGLLGILLSVPAVAVLRIVWLQCASDRNADGSLLLPTAEHPSNHDPTPEHSPMVEGDGRLLPGTSRSSPHRV